jgi:hypothetical protein
VNGLVRPYLANEILTIFYHKTYDTSAFSNAPWGELPILAPAIIIVPRHRQVTGVNAYQFVGADADYGFGSAFAVDRFGGAAQLLSLIWRLRTLHMNQTLHELCFQSGVRI